ncbi:hypothetical protein [Mycobacterium sp. 1465703.0]|uniref:hypothetical protein n=1 Tax=Mycobacterium sp. 1465703.0 TaxID=1834078 RepID=UPI001E39CF52|nr:hypothetical protein [Mycobacterium sp. 1465703.0]
MGGRVFAKGRGRLLAIAASLVVSGAMIHAQGTKTRCCVETPAALTMAVASPQLL